MSERDHKELRVDIADIIKCFSHISERESNLISAEGALGGFLAEANYRLRRKAYEKEGHFWFDYLASVMSYNFISSIFDIDLSREQEQFNNIVRTKYYVESPLRINMKRQSDDGNYEILDNINHENIESTILKISNEFSKIGSGEYYSIRGKSPRNPKDKVYRSAHEAMNLFSVSYTVDKHLKVIVFCFILCPLFGYKKEVELFKINYDRLRNNREYLVDLFIPAPVYNPTR